MPHPQMFMTAIQLVKFQLHALGFPEPNVATGGIWDCTAAEGSVSGSLGKSVR
jgi:hypothetical protein